MVVTDLHGDWDAYLRYRDRFLGLLKHGVVDRLILCGDVIHHEGPVHADRSLQILLDVMWMVKNYGLDTVTLLLGNHELPHLYSFPLSRGSQDYTPAFEAALVEAGEDTRATVMAFLNSLLFCVRTDAGVMINHCGPSALASLPDNQRRLMRFDHKALLASVDQRLSTLSLIELKKQYQALMDARYDEDNRYFMSITDPAHPRYRDLFRTLLLNRANPDFNLLWDAFFNRNERGMSDQAYRVLLNQFLSVWSDQTCGPQTVLVSGHIAVHGGYQILGGRQLRMASWSHAHPHNAGLYLLLDCSAPVHSAEDLVGSLHSVFKPEL